MGSTFADSDFGDSVETQLTLGTLSLLGIFFGIVMICGLFFGFGYSVGRRNGAAMASAVPPVPVRPVAPMTTHEPAPPQPDQYRPDLPVASLTPAEPLATPPAISPAAPPAIVLSTPTLVATNSVPAPIKPSATPTNNAQALLEAKAHIPKPSAIQPVIEQPTTRIPLEQPVRGPQFTAQNLPSPYFVWTPPFDVKRHHGVTRRVYSSGSQAPLMASASSSFSQSSRPTASLHYASATRTASSSLTVQIAALSREDDAEVLASALRQRGFAPSIKSGSEDTLYHVQVGPFSREVAFATRQRLIAKGYNAILK